MHEAEVDDRNIRVEKARRATGYAKTPGKCNSSQYDLLSIKTETLISHQRPVIVQPAATDK